jgi:hypothetical protein
MRLSIPISEARGIPLFPVSSRSTKSWYHLNQQVGARANPVSLYIIRYIAFKTDGFKLFLLWTFPYLALIAFSILMV